MPSIVAQDSASVRRRERALLPLFDRLLPPLAGYPDGSYQSLLFHDPPSHRTPTTPAIPVRVIVCRLDLPGWPHDGETTRLVTTLLDAERYPARTLTAAYHERWEIELTISEPY